MSAVTRGRVVRGPAVAAAERILLPGLGKEQQARMAREEVDAHQTADRIVHLAITRCDAILTAARGEAERLGAEAAIRAAEEEHACLAARWIALKEREERAAARELDRSLGLAKVIAERLIDRALDLEPAFVLALAREALAEARGARRVRLEAHPRDLEALRAQLASAGLVGGEGLAIDLVENDELARGSLRVHTELGTVDAPLQPRIERLAAALRDALQPA